MTEQEKCVVCLEPLLGRPHYGIGEGEDEVSFHHECKDAFFTKTIEDALADGDMEAAAKLTRMWKAFNDEGGWMPVKHS